MRDMDLVREILLAVAEREQSPIDWIAEFSIEGYEEGVVAYHVWLLADAHMLEGIDLSTHDGFSYLPRCLTWSGHEFLETIRDPTVWEHTKAGASRAGSFGLDLIVAIAKSILKTQLKQRAGLDI